MPRFTPKLRSKPTDCPWCKDKNQVSRRCSWDACHQQNRTVKVAVFRHCTHRLILTPPRTQYYPLQH